MPQAQILLHKIFQIKLPILTLYIYDQYIEKEIPSNTLVTNDIDCKIPFRIPKMKHEKTKILQA